MILQSLVEFAKRESLVEDPLFSFGPVSWAIDIGPEGQFEELIDLRTTVKGKGNKKIGRQMLIPKRPIRTSKPLAGFLVDNAAYVLGTGDDTAKAAVRASAFEDMLAAAVRLTNNNAAAACLQFLRDREGRTAAARELQSREFASQELICFRVNGELLHELPALKDYWRSVQKAEAGAQCLVCGEHRNAAGLHTPIKGIPGASTSGVPLISFNQSAFRSYGWEQNENAPVCEACVAAYTTALNRCLSSQFPDPKDPEAALLRQAHTLGDKLVAVYWSDDTSAGVEEAVDGVFRGTEAVSKLFQSPYRTDRISGKRMAFHCLLLQGAQGRATVRAYVSTPIEEIQQNILKWQVESATGSDRPLSILQVLGALAVQNEIRRLPPGLRGELYLAILFDRPIPYSAVQLAVTRNRVLSDVKRGCAALLQAWHNHQPNPKERRLLVSLDPDYPCVGYQLGRLLAVCGAVQRSKNRALNRTLVDRFFAGLSTRPAVVLGPMLRLTRYSQAQLAKRDGRVYLEAEIGEILARIEPDVPTMLTLPQQANFGLGFYHERERAIARAKARKAERTGQNEEGAN